MKDTFTICPAPWRSLYIHPDGDVYPCHRYKNAVGSIKNQSLDQIWNSDKIANIRKAFISGEIDLGCDHCTKMEESKLPCLKNGYIAKSINWNKSYSINSELDDDIKILDISFSSKCNFSCRICGAHQSSSWSDKEVIEDEQQAIHVFEQVKNILPKLDEIIIAGGEPIISDGHLELIKYLDEKKLYNIKLFYNTNFSHLSYKGNDFLNIWKKIDDVTLSISVDGAHEQGELLRKGFVWKDFLDNYQKLIQEAPNVKVIFYCTVGIMNVFHLTTLIDELLCLKRVNPRQIFLNFLEYPEYYNVQVLTELQKKNMSKHIKQYIKRKLYQKYDFDDASILASRLMGLLRYIKENDLSHLFPEFNDVTEQLDVERLENFNKLFPEICSD